MSVLDHVHHSPFEAHLFPNCDLCNPKENKMPRFFPHFSTEFERWLICDRNGSFPFSTILHLTEDQAQKICDIMNEE